MLVAASSKGKSPDIVHGNEYVYVRDNANGVFTTGEKCAQCYTACWHLELLISRLQTSVSDLI